MKVKTISRSSDAYVPVRNSEESSLPRNLNPALHPFERAREYTRALTATKMEKMFSQPFVGQLGNGHRDGIYCIGKNFSNINQVASGSGDGVIKYWDLTSRDEMVSFKAHYGMVTGICVTPKLSETSQMMLSCGDDKTVKLWSVNDRDFAEGIDDSVLYEEKNQGLLKTWVGEHAFKTIDHHFTDEMFVTGGASIQLWDLKRSKYISNLSWGVDNVNSVKFNKTETNVVASSGSDNSIILYDIRTNSPIQKVVCDLRTNAICWNPMEAYNFASASEDHNAYYWDMRNLSKSLNVYKDHVSAVMDLDFSPTGEELVTGSYDKTIRIFKTRAGHSRDIYHTSRMQRIFSVKFTTDARYILSGSDDANIRIWRAKSNDRANIKSSKQRAQMEYDDALKERYKFMPEIKRIARHHHVPKVIKKAQEIKRVEINSLNRRQNNDRQHRRSAAAHKTDREKHIKGVAIKDDVPKQ